jgi:hypothetical protein
MALFLPAHIQPWQIDNLKKSTRYAHPLNPNQCHCGWYTWKRTCGCTYRVFDYKCGATASTTNKAVFCKIPAPKNNVTQYEVNDACGLAEHAGFWVPPYGLPCSSRREHLLLTTTQQ